MEIRHLRETIAVLRTELENARLERGRAVKQAAADAGIEIQQLKSTINALRDELEMQRFRNNFV